MNTKNLVAFEDVDSPYIDRGPALRGLMKLEAHSFSRVVELQ